MIHITAYRVIISMLTKTTHRFRKQKQVIYGKNYKEVKEPILCFIRAYVSTTEL